MLMVWVRLRVFWFRAMVRTMVMGWVWMDGPPLGRACGAVVGPRTDPAGPTDAGRTPTGLLPLDGPTRGHPPRARFP